MDGVRSFVLELGTRPGRDLERTKEPGHPTRMKVTTYDETDQDEGHGQDDGQRPG